MNDENLAEAKEDTFDRLTDFLYDAGYELENQFGFDTPDVDRIINEALVDMLKSRGVEVKL